MGKEELARIEKEDLEKDLIMVESTDPADRDKEVFSQQVLSLLIELRGNSRLGILWMLWGLFMVFYEHDKLSCACEGDEEIWRWDREGVGRACSFVSASDAREVVGLRGPYDKHTPVRLRGGVVRGIVDRLDDSGGKKAS